MGSSEKAESRYVKIADYITANNIGREVLIATLEASGLSFSSVNTEKSRIWGLSRHWNAKVLQRLREGKLTVAAMRRLIVNSPRSGTLTQGRVEYFLTRAIFLAKKDFNRETFFELVARLWDAV